MAPSDALSAWRTDGRGRIAALVLPWLLLFGIGAPLAWSELHSALEAPLTSDRDDTVAEAAGIIASTLDNLRRDAVFLADLTGRLGDEGIDAGTPAASLFLSFAGTAQTYDQVRWLGPSGREWLRVNARASGPELVPPQDLQDKAARPYFRDAAKLPAGSVYYSELDLNEEYGRVEEPHQPMLRVATPVAGRGGPLGVVVINYKAARLLDRLASLSARQGLEVYLANCAGYWLRGPRAADDWAWQLGRPGASLARSQPALWQAMQAADHGEVRGPLGDWAFRRLRPAGQKGAAGALDLYLVVHTAPQKLAWLGWRSKLVIGTVMAGALLLAGWHLRTLLRSMRAEHDRMRELQAAHHALLETTGNLRAVQADLTRSARLSSLGLMVAGVAHELNTPLGSATLALSAARNGLEVLAARLAAGLRRSDLDRFLADSDAALGLAEQAVRRSAGIVQRFKQVAVDRTTMERRRFLLDEAVLDGDPRLRRWDPADPIALRLDLAPGLEMDSYPGPLEQTVSNLVDNALAHAFGDPPAGRIAITARADGDDHVLLSVEDDGRGIPPQLRSQVFEPFYTTNRHRGGTGLGLHIVHQLVSEVLGGSIAVEGASPDGGTRFTLRLPRNAPQAVPYTPAT
ncbi:sensor histidine kinase [Xylophilus sp.]|uniref:sensor histidine kinase n=1 Tax=Xylophilus sp. TaxID=2653893 RepID=UPI002D7E694A|nr:sensor histidine kinase [Xylophilus sp.]